MVQKLGDTASEAGKNNVAFMANFMLGNLEECMEILIRTNRLPEAAFFARTYLPSEIARVLPLWKTELVRVILILLVLGHWRPKVEARTLGGVVYLCIFFYSMLCIIALPG